MMKPMKTLIEETGNHTYTIHSFIIRLLRYNIFLNNFHRIRNWTKSLITIYLLTNKWQKRRPRRTKRSMNINRWSTCSTWVMPQYTLTARRVAFCTYSLFIKDRNHGCMLLDRKQVWGFKNIRI